MERREFFKKAVVTASTVAFSSNILKAGETTHPVDDRKVTSIAFPEKRPMIMYSDRPPLLESPREVFTSALTPNDLFFVRWHMPMIPSHINTSAFRIKIDGLVDKEINFSLKDLKTKFKQVELTAVLQCGGNSRSAFHPTASGIQWGAGAMGCAVWKGVRLKDVLEHAGLKSFATWLGFNGKDKAVYSETANFIREMKLEDLDENVLLAYEMNGEDLPYLNGFPLRLVIPGTYSDSWLKMISHITVTKEQNRLFFMEKAYRIPDNECECETPKKLVEKTKPIEKINVNSIIGYPQQNSKVRVNAHIVVRGVAFDAGSGIKLVRVSIDGGKIWRDALLDKGEGGNFAFRAFRYTFKPEKVEKVTIMCKAISNAGDEQPLAKDIKWNHGGYRYNGIDEVTIEVV
jgi:sulfoxide reductase catalytic subunit YedY